MSNQIKTSIISHANCTDGSMAAFLYYAYYKLLNKLDEVEFIFHQYGKPIPEINGANVIVVDMSFTKEELEHENFKCKHIEIFDHHETAAQPYGGYGWYSCECNSGSVFTALFEKEKSGAGLAWDNIGFDIRNAVYEKSELPFLENQILMDRLQYLVERVQDRDLWKYVFGDTRAVYEVLNSIPKDLEEWWKLIVETPQYVFNDKINEASIRVTMRLEIANSYAQKATVVPYKDKTVAIVNCPSNFASEVGDILGKQHAFAVMFIVSPKDKIVIASLRSNSETGEDVSAIAKSFGGGGHVNAAGFSFDYEKEPTKFLSLMDGSLFTPIKKVIDFKTEITSVRTIIEMSRFYSEWFRLNGGSEGVHSISGDELRMMENIREYLMHEHLKTLSIMQVMELLLNETYLKSTIGSIID
jgi:oligoribonuclease NrnB/cAMP/cGMP phosphodiesterase (DHH superfamily)